MPMRLMTWDSIPSLRRVAPHPVRAFARCVLVVGSLATCALGAQPNAAKRVAEEIRREALLPPNGPAGRPLPLVSHWNMGSQGRGWTPQYQIELLDRGCHILPWFSWPQSDPLKTDQSARRFHDYYDALAVEPWRKPAREYVDTLGMRELQRLYPDPPLVLFVSNNEAPDLRWHQVERSKRYLDQYGPGRSDEFKREVVSRGWMERYPVMFQAMREALVSGSWKKNVRFVGYGAFGPSHFGRWEGWKQYSLLTDARTSPDWHIWQGGSPSYYTHNWDDSRDHWVWSPQVESMNWIFMLEEAWRVNPDFWWEVSLWDGNARDWTPQTECTPEALKESKACQYVKEGQTYTPDRYEGWAQFGLWLLRPRVVREFRGSTTPLAPWRPFFERLLAAVDRVYADQTLAEFWRFGKLVPNPAHPHPYQVDIPDTYRSIPRWFLLNTSLDAPRPWDQHTNIPVFSLAFVRGDEGRRRWLVYAHTPLEDRRDVRITVPGYGGITVDVPRAGAFYRIDQQEKKVTPVRAAGGR
ncbi:MAG: hypothetical protein MUC88_11275 [Planctomycetes bacterium]|nr:hypothetical protein [Planctomycetota bacterium]